MNHSLRAASSVVAEAHRAACTRPGRRRRRAAGFARGAGSPSPRPTPAPRRWCRSRPTSARRWRCRPTRRPCSAATSRWPSCRACPCWCRSSRRVQKRVPSTLSRPKVRARALGSDRMSPTMKAARGSMAGAPSALGGGVGRRTIARRAEAPAVGQRAVGVGQRQQRHLGAAQRQAVAVVVAALAQRQAGRRAAGARRPRATPSPACARPAR